MSKETEELVLIAIVALVVLKMMGSTSSTSALSLAKINSQTNLGYAADATTVITSLADAWS